MMTKKQKKTREYYEKNKERICANNRKYYKDNRDRILERKRKRNEAKKYHRP